MTRTNNKEIICHLFTTTINSARDTNFYLLCHSNWLEQKTCEGRLSVMSTYEDIVQITTP